jgi:hypothetical protein
VASGWKVILSPLSPCFSFLGTDCIGQDKKAEYAHILAAEELYLSQNPWNANYCKPNYREIPTYEQQGLITLKAIAESSQSSPELSLLADQNIRFARRS